ncbi:MAG: glutathione S-transferase family protein [Gammaproteobacteria bacterium]|nr:glutathione S-transferase family protein [Gammaproteobacteria bacterium]
MMKLFWYPRTRSSRTIWLLEEAGVAYDLEKVDLSKAVEQRGDAFLRASPMGKVPAIQDDNVALADSAAIALYIADRYPQNRLAPAIDDPMRGQYLYWMLFSPGSMEPAMAEKVGGWKTNRATHGWGDFDTMISTLEKGLQNGPWILGEQFSAADVMVGSTTGFLRMFDLLPESAVIEAYTDRCQARPGNQKAMQLQENPQ